MKPLYADIMAPKLIKALKKLGADISIARRKRHLSMKMMCERAGLSKQTYQRIEKGDPSVSLGAFAMTLFALNEEHRLLDMLDVATDDIGLISDVSNLPARIRSPK